MKLNQPHQYLPFILAGLCFWISILTRGQNTTRFERFSTQDGLGNNSIFDVVTDSKGYLWLATYDGLSRYDGYEFMNFKPDQSNPQFAGSNIINVLSPDKHGNIWFGTNGTGLSMFNSETGSFSNYQMAGEEGKRLSGNDVSAICHSGQSIWIGTSEGLNRLDLKSDSVTQYFLSAFGIANAITALQAGENGCVWVGTSQGVRPFTLDDGRLVPCYEMPGKQSALKGNIRHLYKDEKNQLWIVKPRSIHLIQSKGKHPAAVAISVNSGEVKRRLGVDLTFNSMVHATANQYWIATSHGIIIVDLDAKDNYKLSWLKNELFNTESLSGNTVTSLYKDREGVIWLGTRFNGLNKYDPYKQPFLKFMKNGTETLGMRSNDVRTLLEDSQGNIWVGYRNEGLDCIPPDKGVILHFSVDRKDENTLPSNVIRGMYEDRQGQLWLGSTAGVSRIIKKGSSYCFKTITGAITDQTGPFGNVYEFYEDSQNRFWMGSTNGVIQYDRNTGLARIYQHDPAEELGRRKNFIRCMTEDQKGRIWLATDGGGIEQLDPETGQLINFGSSHNNTASLSHRKVYCLLFDSQNRLWAGTHSGLNCLEPGNRQFKVYTESDGLANNVVYSVHEDKEGNIWVSTANGLSRLSSNGTFITNYLQGFEFSDDAWWQNEKGEILVGGLNGFYKFDPSRMVKNKVAPQVHISEFYLQNKVVKMGEAMNGRVLLERPITQTKQLVLEHDENFFAFDLVAISLSEPEQIHYQYQLDGFNTTWIDADHAGRKAVFTNVPFGNYRFKLRAANADGVWSREAVIQVVIRPAYYQTTWFKITLVFLILLLIFWGYWLRLRNLTLQKKKLQLEVEEKTRDLRLKKEAIEKQNALLETQKHELEEQRDKVVEMTRQIHEADERKIRFFTSISHEIRTPLTLISGPIERMLDTMALNDKRYEGLQMVQRNTQRLLRLVNQLLDFRKIDTGHMPVQTRQGDLDACVRSIFSNFISLADKRQIRYSMQQSSHAFQVCFDVDVVEKVTANLISNALKYTPEDGEVTVNLDRLDKGVIVLSVSDSGPGIQPDQREAVFKRFFRAEQLQNGALGSGIGLALAKELAILHGGDISIVDNPEGGSCFQFILPVIEEFREETILQPQLLDAISPEDEMFTQTIERYSVLIIEDNDDLRGFIKAAIGVETIYEAADGVQGVQMALERLPDIIISDVLMPGKNGYEVCRLLKQDKRTNHIPILLLTALGAEENQQIGIDCGADDYIVKPFNHRILAGKIRNVMMARQHFKGILQDKLSSGAKDDHQNWRQNLPPFLTKIIRKIEEHGEDRSFGVEELGSHLGMSRSTLYRKLKTVSDKSAVEFIREVRMRLALELLQKDPHLQVAELAQKVGFEDVDYFRQCFKKQFGKTPREMV